MEVTHGGTSWRRRSSSTSDGWLTGRPGLGVAVFGLIDWLAIPGGTRAKAIGLWHGGGNVVVVALFAGSWWLRRGTAELPTIAIVVSGVAVGLALVTGWQGGELVDRLGVGRRRRCTRQRAELVERASGERGPDESGGIACYSSGVW